MIAKMISVSLNISFYRRIAMRRFKLVAITLAIAIMLSPVSVRPSGASGPLFKIFFLGSTSNIDYLKTAGVEIVEQYDSFVLGHMDPAISPTLADNGYQPVIYNGWDTVKVSKYQLKAGDMKLLMPNTPYPRELTWRPVEPSKSDYFVIQFRGPVKKEWTELLAKSGAVQVSTLPENAVVVYMNYDSARIFLAQDFVLGVSPYHAAFKISEGIKTHEDGLVNISVSLFSNVSSNEVIPVLPLQIEYDASSVEAGAIHGKCKPEMLVQIANIPAVMYIDNYIEPTTEMNSTRQILGVSPRTAPITSIPGLSTPTAGVWDKGLKGNGEVVCIQDTGLDTGNVTTLFSDYGVPARIVGHFGYSRTGPSTPPITAGPDPNQSKPWNDTHSHGTFVTGQVAGDGRNSAGNMYAGIAPEAGIVVETGLGWLNPGLSDAYKLGARVHTNSWGSGTTTYESMCQTLDRFVYQYPEMVVTVAAGNSGPTSTTVMVPGAAKNNISVGASGNCFPSTTLTATATAGANTITVASTANFASSQRVRIAGNTAAQDEYKTVMIVLSGTQVRFTTTLSFTHSSGNQVNSQHPNSLANFSSRGPTPDNRIKPDLVAPGSIVNGISLSRPPNYTTAQGTSMATPSLAGTAVLTRQWLKQFEARPKPSAAIVKALLINGARSIVEDYDGTAIQYYPNSKAGWGEVDLYQTLFPAGPTVRKYYDVKSGLATGQKMDFPIVAGSGRFKATLVWSDYEGNPASSPALVNDLDLVITNPTNSKYYNGNQFIANSNDSTVSPATRDSLNNVEGVFLTNQTEPGVYTVTVQASNVPNGPQPFALVVEYQQTMPDFDIRVYPDSLTLDTSFTCGQYKAQIKSLAGFQGQVNLSFSQIAPEFNVAFQTNPIWIGAGGTVDVYFTLCKNTPLKLGKYYFKIKGEFGNIYHEDTLEVVIQPSDRYAFDFKKGVQIGGGIGTFGDNGKQVSPGQKLSYSLNYDKNELNTFTHLYIDDIIPKSVTYNGNSFPLPTHYSTDNGATWINTKAPNQATNPIRLRWQLDQIIGSGRMTKPSTGVPGFDNVSNNTGSSHEPRSVIDSQNNIHVVWSDDTTGNPDDSEIFYSKFSRIRNRWEDLLGNPGFSNISSDGSTHDEWADLSIDSAGNPHFVWGSYWAIGGWPNTAYQIRYRRWNGMALVTASGAPGYDILTTPIGDQYSQYMMPRIKTFGTYATVAFVNYYGWFTTQGIYLTKWNGANWVRMNGTVGLDKIIDNGWGYAPSGLALGLDLSGNPYILYTRMRYIMWWTTPDGLWASKWTPALNNWTYYNSTTVGWEDVFPTASRNQYYPCIAMRGNEPNIVWADYVTKRWINYSKHNGTTWVDHNNTPGLFRVTSSTLYDDNLPCLTLQTNGMPAVGFIRLTNVGKTTEFWFRWLKPSGWTDLLEINAYENVTQGINDCRYPTVVIDNGNIPYFVFQSPYAGNDEVYCTTPTFGWTTNNYPGQIVWEGKIDDQLGGGVSAIVNKAYMSGAIDTLDYSVETVKTESSTTNPFATALTIRKTASSSQAIIGEDIKYTIKVVNTGSVAVTGIVINDVLPNGMTYVRSTPSGTISQNKVVWRVSDLAPGAWTSIDIWCKVEKSEYAGTIIVNDAYVTNTSGVPTAKTSCAVKMMQNTHGYPETDYSIKLLTKDPKAGQEVQLEVKVWASNPPLSYTIVWGDGTTESGNLDPNKTFTIGHTYSSSGDYRVKFSVFDRYNKETVSELTIKVK